MDSLLASLDNAIENVAINESAAQADVHGNSLGSYLVDRPHGIRNDTPLATIRGDGKGERPGSSGSYG
jgi:hypothetical protein